MKKFVSYLLAALVAVGIPLGTCLTSSAASTAPDAPKNLSVLAQSVTSTGFTLVWDKPTNYSNITDYNVVVTQGATEKVNALASTNASSATPYIKQFYDINLDGTNICPGDVKNSSGVIQKAAYKISTHTFCVTGLAASTTYTVSVTALNGTGTAAVASSVASLTQQTAADPTVNTITITDAKYGTVTSSPTLVDSTNAVESQIAANTDAIKAAIKDCPVGGTVKVPAGIYVIKPITLHSDMTLDVEGTLLGSPFADDYTNPYPGDLTQVGQKSASLISTDATDINGNTINYKNIRIVGGGTINGNGWQVTTGKTTTDKTTKKTTGNSTNDTDQYTDSTKKAYIPIDCNFTQYAAGKLDTSATPASAKTLVTAAANHLADNQYEKFLNLGQTAANAYSTRSNLITINNTAGVYIGDGITATNPAQHTIGFTKCSDVVVNGLIALTYDCNNGDGINFTVSKGLTVVNSVFNTGDDCVNFNAGVGIAAEANPSTSDAWIFDNYFGRGHGAVAMGSNTAAWIENIIAEDNVCNGTAIGLRGKSASGTGGGARNIIFRDTAMANITDSDGSAFLLTNGYTLTPTSGTATDGPVFHDITIQNCTVNTTKKAAISFAGAPAADGGTSHYDYNITMSNVAFGGTTFQSTISYVKNSTFKDVVFYSTTPNYDLANPPKNADGSAGTADTTSKNPWLVTNSLNLSFAGNTTAPADGLFPGAWSIGNTLTASNVTDTTATLTWSGTSSGATGYEILDSNGNLLATAGATDTSVNLTGLTAGTKYTLTVASVNAAGNATSGPSVLVTTTGTAASSSTSTSDSNPKTGDTFPAQLPIMLSVVMLAVLVGVRRMRRHAKA